MRAVERAQIAQHKQDEKDIDAGRYAKGVDPDRARFWRPITRAEHMALYAQQQKGDG